MKIVELLAKVQTMSMQEIDELVEGGIEIEQIQYLLFYNDEEMKQTLFRNEKLKQLLLKQINSYAIGLFSKINRNPKLKMTSNLQKICENYLKDFFKEGLELEFVSKRGLKLFDELLKVRKNNAFISQKAKQYQVWVSYSGMMKKFAQVDVDKLSKEQAEQYMLTFEQAMARMIPGYNLLEAEAILKIAQREDIDIAQFSAIDKLMVNYLKLRETRNMRMIKVDEVFSISLDYETLLKTKGVKKEIPYSPIKEMEEAIKNGQFGSNNKLSKEEFTFALKMLKNPQILDSEIRQKLTEILSANNLKLEIGKRELKVLLNDKKMLEQIGQMFPDFQSEILKQIDANIYSMLQDIKNKKRMIMPEEMDMYSNYLKNCFKISLSQNYDTVEMSKLFCLAIKLGHLESDFNLSKLDEQQEAVDFFKKENKKNNVFTNYNEYIKRILGKLYSGEIITQEEFKRYDEIFNRYSYLIDIDNADKVKIIRGLEKTSSVLNLPSKTIENQIERFILRSINNVPFKEKSFYEVILEYYNRYLEGSAIDINKNSAISHLIRASQKGKLPLDISNRVLGKLEERKKRITTSEISSTQDLETYMQNVAEIRLQQGRMPSQCSDFIIKQAILNQGNMAKHHKMVERALEDLTEDELEKLNINDYYISVLDEPFFNDKNNSGKASDKYKTIKILRRISLGEGTLDMLETALHEVTHAKQYKKINSGQLNKYSYRMLKENILRHENKGFYKSNYMKIYSEIEARKNGYINRFKILKRMGLSDSQIAGLQAGNIQKTVTNFCQEIERGKLKRIGQENKETNIIFLELLQQKPELLEKTPALRMEYEINGETVQRRSYANILKSYEQMLNQAIDQKQRQRISSWFSEILLNSVQTPDERMQQELEELLEFESENPIIKAYKKKILSTKFSHSKVMTATMKDFYKGSSEQQRVTVQKGISQGLNDINITFNQEKTDGRNE